MEKKPTMDQLLLQITEILQMIHHPKGPCSKDLSSELLTPLEILETAIPVMRQHLQDTFQKANIDVERVKQEFIESPTSRTSDKQLLIRAKNIERDARLLQYAFSKAMERGKRRTKTKYTQEMKERRKLFKSIGGDKTWIPL